MRDQALAAMLRHVLAIERAKVNSGPELGVSNPEFIWVAEVPGLVQPVVARLEPGLLGRLSESTHVVYLAGLEPEIATGDMAVQLIARGQLTEEVEAGEAMLTQPEGTVLVVGDEIEIGIGGEVRRVVAVGSGGVALDRPLEEAHELGSRVAVRQRYEVLGVEDEGGQGHHRKVHVRRVE